MKKYLEKYPHLSMLGRKLLQKLLFLALSVALRHIHLKLYVFRHWLNASLHPIFTVFVLAVRRKEFCRDLHRLGFGDLLNHSWIRRKLIGSGRNKWETDLQRGIIVLSSQVVGAKKTVLWRNFVFWKKMTSLAFVAALDLIQYLLLYKRNGNIDQHFKEYFQRQISNHILYVIFCSY